VVYNAGSVQSIAAIAFLGAKVRKVSAHGAFMLHSAGMGQTVTSAAVLESISQCIAIDNARIRAILREHVTLTAKQWEALDYMDLHFSAEESVANGIAQEIGEFLPPKGSKLYSL
jgi:ATP-dependent Clp protease protease subunit